MYHSFRPCVLNVSKSIVHVYLIEKFISVKRNDNHNNNKNERQRNHSIIYFCPLSTVYGVWCMCTYPSARMPSHKRKHVCVCMLYTYIESESESKTIARVMSAASKQEQNRWRRLKLLSWVQVIVYGYCSEYLSLCAHFARQLIATMVFLCQCFFLLLLLLLLLQAVCVCSFLSFLFIHFWIVCSYYSVVVQSYNIVHHTV